jgi:hypothetical protein
MKLQLVGEDLTSVRVQADALFANLGAGPLIEIAEDSAGVSRTDPFTVAVGISGIILMLPPMIEATFNLVARSRRNTARRDVDKLKAALAEGGAQCVLTMGNGETLVLPQAATDAVVDAVLEHLEGTRLSESD